MNRGASSGLPGRSTRRLLQADSPESLDHPRRPLPLVLDRSQIAQWEAPRLERRRPQVGRNRGVCDGLLDARTGEGVDVCAASPIRSSPALYERGHRFEATESSDNCRQSVMACAFSAN
jgi:hypothetical protein